MKNMFNYIILLQKYNKLILEHNKLDTDSKNIIYKQEIEKEELTRQVLELESEIKRLKELNLDIKKKTRNKATLQRLKKGDIEQNEN